MRHTTAVRPDRTGTVPTASPATIAQYTVAVKSLRRQCAKDIGAEVWSVTPTQFVEWFVRQRERWSENTIRLYRRGVETYLHKTRARHAMSCAEYLRLLELTFPGPQPSESPQRGTASVKAYVVTEDEVRIVRQAAHLATDTDARILECYGKFGPELGLRPREWAGSKIHGDIFVVPNSKHSNGRANGAYRAILIDKMPLEDRDQLSELCRLLAEAVKSAGSWKKVNDRIASRLARICEDNCLRRLCLYAYRGTACARYKDAGLSPAEIAALMGHAIDTTSFRSYPRARQVRGKWHKKPACRPHSRCVATVLKKYRAPSLLRAKIATAKEAKKNAMNSASNEFSLITQHQNMATQVLADIPTQELDHESLTEQPSLGRGP